MNFEEMISNMHLNSTDAKYMTIFTLSLLEKMHDKLPAYGNFKAFFEECISQSNIMKQPINWQLLQQIRAEQPKVERKTTRQELKAQFIDADNGIIPDIDLTREENIKQWEIYEMSAQYWAQQSDRHRSILRNRKEKFMELIDCLADDRLLFKHTPERIAKWKHRAKFDQDLMKTKGEGFNPIGSFLHNLVGNSMPNSVKLEPQSITFNDLHEEQPKTQEIEKDLTTDNVVRSFEDVKKTAKTYEYYLDKYKDDPLSLAAIESVKDHLPRKEVKVIQKDIVNYNPFNEEEILDSPLLL
jgi:hypothetical protein